MRVSDGVPRRLSGLLTIGERMAHHQRHRNKITPTPQRYFVRRTSKAICGKMEISGGLVGGIGKVISCKEEEFTTTRETDKEGNPLVPLGWD